MNHLHSPLLFCLFAAACGNAETTKAPSPGPAAASQHVVAADPGPALGVVDAKLAGPKDEVIAHGRIQNLVRGFAVFTMMDTELPYCGETDKSDRCETPWDYCCEQQKTRTANSLVVELRSADGKPLPATALADLRLLDDVKAVGKLEKDADGNFTLVAKSLFRASRPELPTNVKWPQ